MKLSFSTKGWQYLGWQTITRLATEMKIDGIELHDINDPRISAGTLEAYSLPATRRYLLENRITVPCIDFPDDIADVTEGTEKLEKLKNIVDTAYNLRAKFVRVHTLRSDKENTDEIKELAGKFLSLAIPYAEKTGVTLLIETVGIFSDTSVLKSLLDSFALDNLAALWDMHNTFFFGGEAPGTTIENLGAYVKHVHIKDSEQNDNGDHQFCLIGKGALPIDEMMNSLRSVNYDGFVSLEWDPAWLPDINDPEIIFPHFVSYMSRYDSTARAQSTLYSNQAKTGKYVWKKDALIDCTFSDVLDRMVEEFPDQYAFKYTTLDYTRTYSEFRDDVNDFARALISLGVRAGHHVAVWSTNLPQWYIAFWATTKIGAVLVSMNTAYKIHEAEYLLRQSDTHTLILCEGYRDSDYRAIINELCPELQNTIAGEHLHSKRLPFLRNVITIGFRQPGSLTWEEAMARKKYVPVDEVLRMAAAVDKNDVCNMQYTSGTTGFPKGVMLTHYNIVNNGKCIGDRMDLSSADRMMIQVPMFHCFGMVLAMTAAMTHGVTLLPLPYFSPKPALACINTERITCFHGVPTMFIAMLEHPDFAKTDFSYMRTGIMAGSPCPISVMQQVVDSMHMTEITIVFGQTEASPGCTMSSTDDPIEVRVGTVGRALPEIECKIVDPETGEDLPDNVTGEFVARGYNIMKGYYKMPKATASAIDKNGWLHTGDLALRTPEGNYRITGRLKDMIIRGGENIYPKEIEEFIYTHPDVKDVQVIGVPDDQYGEEIMACIVLKDGKSMTAEEMKQYIRDHMARHKVPKYIDFVDAFPMNAAGKILKYKMREDAIEKLNLQKAAGIVTA